MCDAPGIVQFMNAVAEMAQGATAPSIQPVWQRELLIARNPPRVTCTHHEFDEIVETQSFITNNPLHKMSCKSFFFGSTQVSSIRKKLPHHLLTTAGELCENPLEYALELVRTAKANVTEEYVRSFIDLVVTKGRPHTTIVQSYVVSNTVRVGLYMDYGWGKAVYGGLAKIFERPSLSATTFYIQVKNSRGEDGIMVPMCLPTLAMERFVKEVHSVLNDQSDGGPMSTFINSSM
uniref:O-acyltransferase WSD1 C-terminal domain-containing protein n=1 Tax=Fagus sylvatica TaxID=28930 RepID=A0A2N9GL91_FAGSY